MAGREFTVKGTITTDTKSAERNTRALTKAQEELATKLEDLRAKFDAGTITALRFAQGQARLERQSQAVAKALSSTGDGADAATGRITRFANFLSSRLVVTFGDVANAAQRAYTAIIEGAQRVSQESALRTQIDDLDAFLAKLDEVAQGTVSRASLIASSSKAVLLGIPADEIASLLEIARGAAVATGQSIEQAFNDIVTGIGRASPLILDNLGIVVKLEEAYSRAAEQLGKTTDELTGQERAQALLGEVLDNNLEKYREFTAAQDQLSSTLQRGAAAMTNAKNEAIALGTGLVQGILGGASATVVGIQILVEGVLKLLRVQVELAERLPIVGGLFTGLGDAIRSADDAIDVSQRKFAQYAIDLANAAAVNLGLVESQDQVRRSTLDLSAAQASAGPVLTSYRNATSAASDALDDLSGSEQVATTRAAELSASSLRVVPSLSAMERQAIASARAFDAMAAAGGRALAVQQALEGGATLTNGGTRIRFPNGGSRLTREAGLGASRRESRFVAGLDTIA
jgi:hypothetical protein